MSMPSPPPRDVGFPPQQHGLALFRNAVRLQSLFGQHFQRVVIQFQQAHDRHAAGQHPFTFGAKVFTLDQFRDGRGAVARDLRGAAMAGGDHAAIDDQQAIFLALDQAFDQHMRGHFLRAFEGPRKMRLIRDPDSHAAPHIAVAWFHHDGKSDPCRKSRRRAGVPGDILLRHGQACLLQNAMRNPLVARQRATDRRGIRRFRPLEHM